MESDNFQYILPDNGWIAAGDDTTEIGEEFQNVVYAGGPTVLLEGNGYYIQTGDGDAVVLNGDDNLEDLYVNEIEQSEDDTVQYVQEDDSSIVYKVDGKRLKMENGKFLTLDSIEQFQEELGILNEVTNSDSSVQYAVLKDGQLHLQISENDTVEILNNRDLIDADGRLEVQLYSEDEGADGKNAPAGKPVSLDDYFERIARGGARAAGRDAFLNQKFTIGRKSNGKYLVGKILNIRTAAGGDSDDPAKAQELTFDVVEGDAEPVRGEGVTEEQRGFLSRTLSGLTEMPSVQKKLVGKPLDVKLIEKRVNGDGEREKKVNEVCGFLTEHRDEEDVKYYTFSDRAENQNNLNFQLNSNGEGEDIDVQINNREATSLVIVTTTDGDGQKATRVTFADGAQPTCALCGRRFRSQPQLSRHVSSAHAGGPPRKEPHRHFACGRRFASQGRLPPGRQKTFECLLCGGGFAVEAGLFAHLAGHRDTAYCCQCSRSFASAADLNVHKRSHHPSKCYHCETCGRQFSRHSNLLRHEEIHGGQGSLHKCTICGCSYKYISSLTRHIVQNHIKKC